MGRKWQPSPVFLLGNRAGRGTWQPAVPRVTESDRTEQLSMHTCMHIVKNNLETLEFHIEPIQDLLFEEVQVGR